jgi:hypothetical protein
VNELAFTMRREDAAEARALGIRPSMALRESYRQGVMRRVAIVGDRVAAMWGVCGTPLAGHGRPWLVTAWPCRDVSALAFARVYRAQALEMLRLFPLLENYVDARYTGAVRMLGLAGFSVSDPEPYGRRGMMFRRFEMVAR